MTTTLEFPLSDVHLDARTQVRAGVYATVVTTYGEQMTAGVVFPPITLFDDGTRFRLVDGYHRVMAARQIGRATIPAEVHLGTREDALWFALGANRANGLRLTARDVKKAIRVAVLQFPDRSTNQLAEQIGCSQRYVAAVKDQVRATATLPDHVTGKDGKTYPAFRAKEEATVHPQHEAIVTAVQAGTTSRAICRDLHVRSERVADVRRALGVARPDMRGDAVQTRHEQIQALAADGHTTRQIASELGLSVAGCRKIVQKLGLTVLGDTVTRGIHRHDANRIVGRIVQDAENLVAGATLINFAALDHTQVADWVRSLQQSQRALRAFTTRLIREQRHEAVEPQAVQDPSGPDCPDAGGACAAHATGVSPGARE